MRVLRAAGVSLLSAVLCAACQGSSHRTSASQTPPAVKPAYASLAGGHYAEALLQCEPLAQGPASQAGSAEAVYLKGYVLAFGQLRLKEARDVLRGMVDEHAKHPLAPLAQKALADSFYWQGDYPHALAEYARLRVLYGSEGWGAYALYQSGQCLLLQRKDGDALAVFRDAAEKYPGDPMSDAALLRVAEVYRRLDDGLQARDEFQHVLRVSKDPAVRGIAMDELESIEQEAENPKMKGAHSP